MAFGWLAESAAKQGASTTGGVDGEGKSLAKDPRVTFWNTIRTSPHDEPRAASLKAHCRRGLPPQLRPALWLWLSGGAAMAAASPPGTYASLSKPQPTLPKDVLVAIEQDAGGRPATRRLLTALCQLRLDGAPPSVVAPAPVSAPPTATPPPPAPLPLNAAPFARGLGALASFVASVQGPGREEAAFWTLVALLQRRLIPYASTTLAAAGFGAGGAYAHGFRVEARVLDQLAAKKLPAVGAHLARLDSSVAALVAPWMSSAFVSVLAPETAARLLDCLVLESKVLLRAGLALLKLHAATIAGAHSMIPLRVVLEARLGRLVEPEALLSVAFKGVGSMGHERIALTRAHAQRAEAARARELASQLALVLAPRHKAM